jgi:hypothetical protein
MDATKIQWLLWKATGCCKISCFYGKSFVVMEIHVKSMVNMRVDGYHESNLFYDNLNRPYFDKRAIICQTFVEVYQTMFHAVSGLISQVWLLKFS